MTTDERERLRGLLREATPGPWTNDLETVAGRVWIEGPRHAGHYVAEPIFTVRPPDKGTMGQREKDATLIAAARTALPELLDDLDAAEARVRVLKEALQRIRLSATNGNPMDPALANACMDDIDNIARAALATPRATDTKEPRHG